MPHSLEPFVLVPVLLAVACGPDVASQGVETETTDTEATDTEATETEATDTEATDTEGTSESSPVIRMLYPTDAGIVVRESTDGDLGEVELITSSRWTNLLIDGDTFVARATDGPGHLFGDAVGTPPLTIEVDCPVENGCFPTIAADTWLLSERTLSQDASSGHYLVEAEGPVLLYTSEPLGLVGISDEALVARETTPAGTQLVRVPLVPGGEAETLLEVDPSFSLSLRAGLVVLRPPSDVVWYESLGLVDTTVEAPTLIEPSLLPGRTLHGVWTSVGLPGDGGVLATQGYGESAADVAWIPLTDGGAAGAPILVSSGAIEGKVAFNPSQNPIVTSPGKGWLALRTKLDPQSPTGAHLVPRDGSVFGEPVPLGAGTSVAHFSPDDGEVFFWTYDEDASSLSRAPLAEGSVGAPSVIFEMQDARYSIIAEDGSTIAILVEGESAGLWVLDLLDAGASARLVPECGAVNVFARISPDGSLLACSSGEDFTQGRAHAVLDVRGGNVTELLDAVDLPRFVILPSAL